MKDSMLSPPKVCVNAVERCRVCAGLPWGNCVKTHSWVETEHLLTRKLRKVDDVWITVERSVSTGHWLR